MSKHFLKILNLAYKNLFRNKRRTLFAIFIAAAGYAAMAIALGYYNFSIYALQEMTIRNGFSGAGGTGHIQIKDKRSIENQEKYTLEYGLTDYQNIIKTIKVQPEVDYVLPRIEFGGLVSTGEKSFPFIGYGNKPGIEAWRRNCSTQKQRIWSYFGQKTGELIGSKSRRSSYALWFDRTRSSKCY
jgi:putative ABC transport system permease protein